MPIYHIIKEADRAWAIWNVTETEEELLKKLTEYDVIPQDIKVREKRLEWMAGRILVATLLPQFKVNYQGLYKDEFGKPYLKRHEMHISLSHSFPYVATIVDKNISVGIDLEQPKEKLLKIAPRVLHDNEVRDAGIDRIKHCIYWCAKETLIKLHGKKNLFLSKNLLIEPFTIQEEGHIIGRIIVEDDERMIPLVYKVYPHFVIVFNQSLHYEEPLYTACTTV